MLYSKSNSRSHGGSDTEVVSYLFSFTIFIINIGQDKINPSHSITEEHRVFTVLLFVNL